MFDGSEGEEVMVVESLCRNKGGTISRMRSTFSTNAGSQAVKQIRPRYIRGVPTIPRTSARRTRCTDENPMPQEEVLVTDTNRGNAACTQWNLFMTSSGTRVFTNEKQINSREEDDAGTKEYFYKFLRSFLSLWLPPFWNCIRIRFNFVFSSRSLMCSFIDR